MDQIAENSVKNSDEVISSKIRKRQLPSKGFEWIYVIFSLWFLTGIYWDAWAHTHIPEQESFFSIYHLVMYTGAGALSGLICGIILINFQQETKLLDSIPVGYTTAFAGVIVFMTGGVGDMIWHETFGIEQDLEASFSATHILLMIGIQLFLVAPFYSAWIRGETNERPFIDQLPKILSFGFLLSGLMVISQWAHPFVVVYATEPRGFGNEAVGMLSFFIQTVFLMGPLLLSVKEKILPAGSYTIALTINAFALTVMRDNFEFLPIAIITGLIIDIFVYSSKFSILQKVRYIAILTPLIYYTLYFIVLTTIKTITWSIHLVSGAVVIGITISLLISVFILPPQRLEIVT